MKKQMLLFRGEAKVSYTDFTDLMLHTAGLSREICNATRTHITFTDSPPPPVSVIPFRRSRVGMISLLSEEGITSDYIQRSLQKCSTEIWKGRMSLAGAYEVEEALPVSYTRDWGDLEFTPGVCLLTLFRRKPGLSHEAFIDRWHNSHTPLSLRIHPLWHYSRNVVTGTVIPESEPWEGLVEEHFRKRSQLLNPLVFFGNPLTMFFNMIEVYRDTNAFLDYKTIETYLVREIVIKS